MKYKKGTSLTDLSLFVEALSTSVVVKLALLFIPFRKFAHWLGRHNEAPIEIHINEKELTQIKRAVWRCNKYTFWRTECYTLALTAKLMLKRRNIPGTLYIGFADGSQKKYEGHAWLKVGDDVVTGNCDLSKFKTIFSFT